MRHPKKKTKKVKRDRPQRGSDGRLLPGQCGNPKGRPKGSKNRYSIAELWNAIKEVENKKGRRKLLVTFVEQAYTNPVIMTALMKKLLPDLKSVESLVASFESSMTDEMAQAIQDKLKERYVS